MLTKEQVKKTQERAWSLVQKAGIVLTAKEIEAIEIADFALGRLEQIGLEVLVYVNTDRVCAKEIIMFPWQTCPEHMHPTVNGQPGKEETFRCRWGEVRLYVPGSPANPIKSRIPADKTDVFTVKHEVVLHPGEQYTLMPATPHWFQAGPEGAIVSEFSTHSTDEFDIFTDPAIRRLPEIQ